MKNILNKLLVLILILVPFAVKADMSSPENVSYKVTVSNTSGTCDYDYDNSSKSYVTTSKCFAYGTELTVQYEFNGKVDGKTQLFLETEMDSNTRSYYLLLASDTTVSGDFDVEYIDDVSSRNISLYVYYGEVPLFNAPSLNSGLVSDDVKVPAKTTLKVYKEYGLNNTTWSYIEYKGTSGWVYSYPYNGSGYSYILANKVSNIKNFMVVTDTIEAFTSEAVSLDDFDNPVTLTIPKGTLFEPSFQSARYYVINYEGTDYWLNYYDFAELTGYSSSFMINAEDFTAYTEVNKKGHTMVIPANTKFYEEGSYCGSGECYFYFEYDSRYYWASYSDVKFANNYTTTSTTTIPVEMEPEDYLDDYEEEYDEDYEDDYEEEYDDSIDDRTLIVYLIFGSIGLAIAIGVIIFLINKKNKQKKNKDKEDKKEEEKNEKKETSDDEESSNEETSDDEKTSNEEKSDDEKASEDEDVISDDEKTSEDFDEKLEESDDKGEEA